MSIRFLVFSDMHYDTVEDGDERISKIIKKVKENQLDFCISLGDFCEPVLENKRLVNAFLIHVFIVKMVLKKHFMKIIIK